VEGAEFNPSTSTDRIVIHIPASDAEAYPHAKVVFHFSSTQNKGKDAR
jgi:hypothetical protein